jgi:hypothetical protein
MQEHGAGSCNFMNAAAWFGDFHRLLPSMGSCGSHGVRNCFQNDMSLKSCDPQVLVEYGYPGRAPIAPGQVFPRATLERQP